MPNGRARWSLLFAISPVMAQVPVDTWVFGARPASAGQGGIWLLDPGGTTWQAPQPQSVAMQAPEALATDGSGLIWFATAASGPASLPTNELFLLLATPSQVVAEWRLTNGSVSFGSGSIGIGGIVRERDRLWYCTLEGRVGFVDPFLTGQTPTVVRTMTLPVTQALNAITSDGRELFLGLWESSLNSGATIWALDLANPTAPLRAVASTRVGGLAQTSTLSLGPDGTLLVGDFDGRVRSVDPRTGSVTVVGGAVPMIMPINGAAYHPWLDQYAEGSWVGTSTQPILFLAVGAGQWSPNVAQLPTRALLTGVAVASEPPFTVFGRGCACIAGAEPRVVGRGLPVAGGTASIDLVGAFGAGSSVCVLGWSDAVSSFGALPFDATPLGAPGCALRVSMDVLLAHPVVAGAASQPLALPASASLAGLVAHAQWLVLAPVNGLGLCASDGLQIRLR